MEIINKIIFILIILSNHGLLKFLDKLRNK